MSPKLVLANLFEPIFDAVWASELDAGLHLSHAIQRHHSGSAEAVIVHLEGHDIRYLRRYLPAMEPAALTPQ
jgi:hypothetical protein